MVTGGANHGVTISTIHFVLTGAETFFGGRSGQIAIHAQTLNRALSVAATWTDFTPIFFVKIMRATRWTYEGSPSIR